MRRKSYNDPGHAHYLTFSCYRRQQLLTDDKIKLWFAQELDNAREKEQFAIWAYVIMPEHVHLLIHPYAEEYAIGRILRRIKEPLAHRVVTYWRDANPPALKDIRTIMGKRTIHRFWQAGGGFDRNLYDLDRVRRAITYIEYNPVRRGLVENPTDWFWSSACARAGTEDVPMEIDRVEFKHRGLEERSQKP